MKRIVVIFLSEKKLAFSLEKDILLLIKVHDEIVMLSDNLCWFAEDVFSKIILISACKKKILHLVWTEQWDYKTSI